MIPKRRIYISAPADGNLDQDQLAIKMAILRAIEDEGFEPQEFFSSESSDVPLPRGCYFSLCSMALYPLES